MRLKRMEFWFVLAIIVAMFWGSAGIFAKYSTPRLGVARVALLIAAVEGPMYALAFIVWNQSIHVSVQDALLAVSSCLVGVIGYLCFFESIMEGQVAIAGTISAAYPALTVLGAFLILSESLTLVQSVGVVAIVSGVIALSYEPEPGGSHALNKRSLAFALAAFALWGLWSLTSKMAVDRVTAGNVFGFYVISSFTAPLLYVFFRKGSIDSKARPGRMAWAMGALALAINVSGTYAYTYALQDGTASLVVPISSAYPIVTVVLAIAFLRERINRLHTLSLGIVIIGLVLIGVTI